MRKVLTSLGKRPNASVPEATGSASESQSIYRFWANPKVSIRAIMASHRDGVMVRARGCQQVLAIQDTTELNYTSHPATSGLGFINQSSQQGMKVHSCFAVSGQGEPLGVLHQYAWSREQRSGKRGERRKQPIAQKESYRWLRGMEAAEQGRPEEVQWVHVGDREADIFELFAQPRSAGSELLIRAEHNRKVRHELGYLVPTLEQAPVLAQMSVELERNPKRAARVAHLRLKAMAITLEVPGRYPKSDRLEPIPLNAILVEEPVLPEDGTKPIRWLLLTTLPIDSAEQLHQAVRWYSYRWLIERFHYTLKSGCGLEQLQLETAFRLRKALATYSILAWRLMWLTYRARLTPNEPCDLILNTSEWRLLQRKFMPKSRSKQPPSLRQAVRWIAQLGGFLDRKHDGEPGLKTLWRGLTKFHDLVEGAQLASKS
ncbi:MAG: IS4 family transposase [Cyanobacteria bacterium Co-bin8]|nr:IS4 family transposase [Cyanobacteria bacterium Co-bin8]